MTSPSYPDYAADDNRSAAEPSPQEGWSQQQLLRLENEWRRLQRAFAYHPHVHVGPLGGDPPDQYEVEYRLRTVIRGETGQLEYAQTCWVHIWLPPGFPHEPPLVRPVTDIFHPNVAADGIYIGHIWLSPENTLVDVVMGVGEMLAYQICRSEGVVNADAWEWMHANPGIFPLDPDVSMSPDAGGEPLARICRLGPRTIEQVRAQLKQMCDSLLAADGAPGARDTHTFARRVRQGLSLFLEEDIPEGMRTPAADLDEFARELASSAPVWEAIRRYRAAADRALAAAHQLREVHGGIAAQLRAVQQIGAFSPASHPTHLMRQIPPAARLQLHAGNLAAHIQRAGPLLEEARQARAVLAGLPALDAGAFAGALRRRLDAEIRRASELADGAAPKLEAAAAELRAAVADADLHLQAVQRAAAWREYADLLDRGGELCRRVMNWGPAGVGAFFIDGPGGRFGPFEMEQMLTLGDTTVAVRNPVAMVLEVIAAETGAVLARGEGGTAVLNLTDPASGKPLRTSFDLAGNCEEIAIQLDYLAGECDSMLSRLAATVAAPPGWLGRTLGELSSETAQEIIRAEHAAALRRWRTLRDDLRSLRPLKERLASFRLLQRLSDVAARLHDRRRSAEEEIARTEERLSAIVSASNTDPETGRLLVPHRYAREYAEQLARRDLARQELARAARLLQVARADAAARLSSVEKLGFCELPALESLGELPPAWAELLPHLADDEIAARISEIEQRLGVTLKPAGWPPPAPAQVVHTSTDGPPAGVENDRPPPGGRPAPVRRPADPTQIFDNGRPPAQPDDHAP